VCAESVDRAIFHAHGDAAETLAIVTHDEVHGEIFHEEEAVILESHTIEGVEDSMASAVSCRCATVSLPTLAKLQALATKCTLIDLAFFSARERKSK
jgi:hypothetical protein